MPVFSLWNRRRPPGWQCDRVLDRIHHALYVACREKAEREASPTAAIIDSQSVKSAEKGGLASIRMAMMRAKSQGQEAPYTGRYAGFAAPCHRALRRHSGPRWRHLTSGDDERPVSIPREAFCRQRLSGADFCERARQNPASSRNRNRQTIRSRQRVRTVTQALDRRTNHRMAQSLSPARQGLGKSQPQRPRVLETCLHPPHAAKAL